MDNLKIISFDSPPPEVFFEYRFFIFTGHFLNTKRKFCEEEVVKRGGVLKLNRLTNYLVIGAGLYECIDIPLHYFNNKMEAALSLRSSNSPIKIISEHHFIDSLKNQNIKILEDPIKVESSSVAGKEYFISLKDLTCTCPNFIEDRSGYSMDDPIRLCKHLVKVLYNVKYVPQGLKNYVEKIAVAAIYNGGIPGFKSTWIAY